MSEENVEIVRELIAAVGRADYEHAAEFLHPDAEWRNTAAFPGPRAVVGADAISEFWRDMFDAYGAGRSDSSMEVEEVTDGGEVVAILVHGHGQGRRSGIPIDTRWAHTIRIHDSKVLRIETYGRYASALEAAGLKR